MDGRRSSNGSEGSLARRVISRDELRVWSRDGGRWFVSRSEVGMVPLLVMVVAWIAVRMAGIVGLTAKIDSWTEALPFALAAMFMFTAASHFVPRLRTDLMRMVPRHC